MGRRYTYILCCMLATLLLQGCGPKRTNWTVSMQHKDKSPYGTYLAYESLKYYFPGAKTEVLSKGFRYDNMSDKMKYANTSLLVMEGLNLYVSESELFKILDYAAAGNEVLIFASNIDDKLSKKLGIRKLPYGTTRAFEDVSLNESYDGSENTSALSLPGHPGKKYGYYGRFIQGYFVRNSDSLDSETDSSNNERESKIYISPEPDTQGSSHDDPDFLRYKVGEGHITIHAAPLVLSNYFLLQPGNREYLETIWHSFPKDISQIYWNEYYKRTTDKSDMGVLWRYPATRYGLLLALFGMLLYILFEGKRRQRIQPIVAPLENSSVSFVETVGRLYYNKGDHSNLAEKMIQHFLEWVRSYHYLNTNHLNEEFIAQLVNKTGQHEEVVRSLMYMIHEIRNGYKADEAYLYRLYNNIERFYKNKT